MGLTRKEQRELAQRRALFAVISVVFFVTIFFSLLYLMQALILPFILGAFFAYVFRPLIQFKGSPYKRYFRAFVLIAAVSTILFMAVRIVRDSLPSEKQKLELLVRLQYQLNSRFEQWMGLNEKAKGNFIYKTFGSELQPLMQKMNEHLSLSDAQNELFSKYSAGFNGEKPIAKKYVEYHKINLSRQQLNLIEKREPSSFESVKNGDVTTENEIKENKQAQLPHLIKLFTLWLVFPLTFMFILTDKGQIIHFFMRLIPNRYFELTMNVVHQVDQALGKYIRGTALECSLVGFTLILGFYLIGIPIKFAILIGLLGGITNAIPFVGTFIACFASAVYALIAEDIQPIIPFINENNLMIAAVVVVLFAHLLDNAIYQPLVVGGAVNIHPLVVILGVFGGSLAFGFAGLLLAIPTIVVTKVVVQQFYRGLKDYKII